MKTVVSSSNNTNTTPAVVIPKNEQPDAAGSTSTAMFQTPSAATLKRPASLDLNKVTTAAKKRLIGPSPLLLEPADLQNIKTVNTPDLEKFLLSSNLLQTPQPGVVFPTKVGPVTSEQEAFGKGFEEALHNLHTSKSSQLNSSASSSSGNTDNSSVNNTVSSTATTTATNGMSGGSFTYTNLENFPIAIKDEPQQPNSPPVSPIDMETQEKIKLERKRQRNRVAASKCRRRKLERISKLEDKVKILKGENTDLGAVVKTLKDHVAQLKQKVIGHIEAGCSIPNIFNSSTILQGK